MNTLLSVSEMYRADRLAIAAGTSSLELMENAGQGIAREINQYYAPRKVLVLCGPGNNGGDGFVIARGLRSLGWDVSIVPIAQTDQLPFLPAFLADTEMVVDAMFGAGLTRPLEGAIRDIVQAVNLSGHPVIAVDLPSGVNGDTGAIMGEAIRADRTITFFRKKSGHLLQPGRSNCGITQVLDIGIPSSVLSEIKPQQWENTPRLWRSVWPLSHAGQHKYDRGHALIACGGVSMSGAARLAARAALRVGSGLVTLAVPADAINIVAAQSTAVMVAPYMDYSVLLADQRRNALLLGPGNGISEGTRANVLAALASGRPTVLDADALTVFAGLTHLLAEAIKGAVVLTPHEGEFARLFSRTGDKLASVRQAAKEVGAVVLLKGTDTVIAAPDGRATINTNAPETLATAGSGDVLAGIITGLLAQGMPAFEAAAAGAWLHGAAARKFGPGLIAEDIPDRLPAVLADLA